MNAVKPILSVLVLTLVAGALHGEELLRNGDFERGTSGWKGDRKVIEYSADNKVCRIEVDDEIQAFYQADIDVEDLKDVVLTFKYQISSDYSGRGLTMQFVRPDGSWTYRTINLENPGKWQTYKWHFGEIRGAEEITLKLEILEGEGTVMFDDISVQPK